ncbi:MAG: hypothetical protein RLZZ626_904 [Actinomycetota bacterium]|jgi:hypothetical protein
MRLGHKRSWIYAALVAALGTPLSIWYSGQIFEPSVTEYNLTSIVLVSTNALVFGTVFAALGGAIEGSRLRGGKYASNLSSRRHYHVLIDSLAPSFLACLLILIATFIYWLPKAHGFFSPAPWTAFITPILVLLAELLFGFNLGLRLPSMVALPLAMVLPFLWLSLSMSSGIYALKFMTGEYLGGSCCRIYQQPMQSALVLGFGFNLIATLLLYFVADVRKVRRSAMKSGFKVALGGVAVFSFLGLFSMSASATGIENRSFKETTCSTIAPVICLFPMQDPQGQSAVTLAKTWAAIRETSPDLPARVIGANLGQSTKFGVGAVVTPTSRQIDVAFSLVSDYVGSPAICQESDAVYVARDRAYGQTLNFLLMKASKATSLNLSGYLWPIAPKYQAQVQAVLAAPVSSQKRWQAIQRKTYLNCLPSVSTNG